MALLLFIQLFIVALIVCVSFALGPCFVIQYSVSLLVLQSSCWGREREGVVLLLLSLDVM